MGGFGFGLGGFAFAGLVLVGLLAGCTATQLDERQLIQERTFASLAALAHDSALELVGEEGKKEVGKLTKAAKTACKRFQNEVRAYGVDVMGSLPKVKQSQAFSFKGLSKATLDADALEMLKGLLLLGYDKADSDVDAGSLLINLVSDTASRIMMPFYNGMLFDAVKNFQVTADVPWYEGETAASFEAYCGPELVFRTNAEASGERTYADVPTGYGNGVAQLAFSDNFNAFQCNLLTDSCNRVQNSADISVFATTGSQIASQLASCTKKVFFFGGLRGSTKLSGPDVKVKKQVKGDYGCSFDLTFPKPAATDFLQVAAAETHSLRSQVLAASRAP